MSTLEKPDPTNLFVNHWNVALCVRVIGGWFLKPQEEVAFVYLCNHKKWKHLRPLSLLMLEFNAILYSAVR